MSTTNTKEELYTFDNAEVLYDVQTVTTYKQKSARNMLPKVPYETWQQVVSFMKHIANSQNTEAIVSLTIIDGVWKVICWHQDPTGTLHVDFKEGSDENQEMLSDEEKAALLVVHCTVHSHNKIGASQSSDDADDELGKEGWHVTVGNCDKEILSTHCRMNCKQIAEFDKKGKKTQKGWQVFVECPISEIVMAPRVPKKYKPFMKNSRVLLNMTQSVEYPAEWNDRAKKKPYKYQGTPGRNSHTSTQTTTGVGHTNAIMGRQNKGAEVVESIIDCRFPFEAPARLTSPEWILSQEIYTLYKGQSLIQDVIKYSSVQDQLRTIIQRALDNTEIYFITELGLDSDLVNISLPSITDIIDYLHDELTLVSARLPIKTNDRLKDKELVKNLYENFKTQSIFGSMES